MSESPLWFFSKKCKDFVVLFSSTFCSPLCSDTDPRKTDVSSKIHLQIRAIEIITLVLCAISAPSVAVACAGSIWPLLDSMSKSVAG